MDDGLFEIVLDKVKNFLNEKGLDIDSEKTLMQALPLVIECVESFKNKGITGIEKRNLALKVTLFIVNSSSLEEGKKSSLKLLIEGGTLETTIDIIVDASKGKFELNRKNKHRLLVCLSDCLEHVAASYASFRTAPVNSVETDADPESTANPESAEETAPAEESAPAAVPETAEESAPAAVPESAASEDEPLPELPEKVTSATMV